MASEHHSDETFQEQVQTCYQSINQMNLWGQDDVTAHCKHVNK